MTVKSATALAGCLAALAAGPASAVFTSEFTWEFPANATSNCLGKTSGACNTSPAPQQNNFGNIRTATSGSATLNAQAWSDTGMPGSTASKDARTLATGYLAGWSGGLGVQNRDLTQLNGSTTIPSSITPGLAGGGDDREGDSPEHSMDGHDRIDSILLYSATEFSLSGLKFGWTETDSDIFVLAYTAGGDPTATMGTKTYSDLNKAGSGWQLVSNYPNVVQGAITEVNKDSPPVSANYWLIGAYTTAFGTGGCYVSGKNKCSEGNDYMKLLVAYGNSTPGNGVPEPSALLLFGIALAGIWGTRRKRA